MKSEQQVEAALKSYEDVDSWKTVIFLYNAALKEVVDKNIHQRGSNITVERMRFDFNCDHKLTDEEKKNVEDLVNKWIDEGLDVRVDEMSKQEAIDSGAECMFIEKYPDMKIIEERICQILKFLKEILKRF